MIGTKASHGCIRMYNRDVLKLLPGSMGTMVYTASSRLFVPSVAAPSPLRVGIIGERTLLSSQSGVLAAPVRQE